MSIQVPTVDLCAGCDVNNLAANQVRNENKAMAKQDDKFKDLLELSKQLPTSNNTRKSNTSSSSPISSPSGTESDHVQYSFLGPNIILDAVDEAKYPIPSPTISKTKRSTPKSRAKKADDAVREDNKKRQKYFRDQMKELFEKLSSVLRPPLGRDEKTKKILLHTIDYIETLHATLEYYQNLTQQIAAMNPELFQFVSSQSPPPTPTHSSRNSFSVVSSTPPSPCSTNQSNLSQGTASSSRARLPSSPGSTDFSSESSWISQVLQFPSPSRSPGSPLSQYDINELEKYLSQAQFPSGTNSFNNNMASTDSRYRNQSLQQPHTQIQQQQQQQQQPQPQQPFDQYSSFLSVSNDLFDMAPSPIAKPAVSPSHSWNSASNLDMLGMFPATNAPATLSSASTTSTSKSKVTNLFSAQTTPPGVPQSLSSYSAVPGSISQFGTVQPKPTVAIKLEPTSQQRHPAPVPSSPGFQPTQPAYSQPELDTIQASIAKPSLACDEEAFDWSSVSNTPNQTPDRKPIPSLEALSDSLQSLTVSKANAVSTMPTVVIKTEK